MELLILNEELEAIDVLDSYESLIWVERYNEAGEFELCVKASSDMLVLLATDYYLQRPDSDYVMVIEGVELKTDWENGDTMIFTGKTVDTILSRRIVWRQTVIDGNLQNGIKTLLLENVINPTDISRKIDTVDFQDSVDTSVTSLTVKAQALWSPLDETIRKLCSTFDLGYRMFLSDDNSKFIYMLYKGKDRSYDQTTNPYVIFSPEFDNLITSEYKLTKVPYKNVCLVAGEGEGVDRKTVTIGSVSGLSRRETYTDASSISQTVDEVLIPEADYLAQLSQKGLEDLANKQIENSSDAQIEPRTNFVYGEDFFLGDIVQIENQYGVQAKARVSELVRSDSTNGVEVYPKFTII